MDAIIIGKVIDNYRITEVLGKGGMGVVYKAKDTTLDRDVALKMMDARLASDENFLKRFQSEAKALAKLQNPNIVSIFALRESEFGFCIVMEYVEGNTLADKISEMGALPLSRTLAIFKQLLIALDHAHKAGIIHRDIKPSNVMLTKDDVVKVTDFGLAKIQQTSAVTMTMGTGGTLFYMSPEQVRGLANVDQRGDIYSLGMTLYETLTGKTPFTESDTDFSIRQAIVEGKIPPPDRLRPDLPKDLVKVVMKAIDKDPAKRFQTAAEMWTALEKVQIPLPVVDKGTTIDRGGSRSFDPQTKSRRMVYLAIAGVTAVVLFFALRLWMSSPSTTLSISSEPNGSKVFFNGDSVGMTPLTNITVRPGNLSLRLDREGYYTKDTALVLTKGENVSIGVPLRKIQTAPPETAENFPPASSTKSGKAKGSQPKEQSKQTGMATLSLRAMPTGFVTVDGTMRSGNTNQVTTVEVASGERTILFEHPVYGSKILQLTLTPGETKTITCYFESYVSIQSLPVWGTIMIDGKNTDVSTPKDRYPLGVGKHRVTVTRAGYETVEGDKEITIMPAFKENVYQLVFNLRKK